MKSSPVAFLALLTLLLAPTAAQAQIREACKADVAELCSSVEQTRRAIGACLKENQSRLSASCSTAFSAVSERKKNGVRAKCMADIKQHCASVERNREAIGACLAENQPKLSDACNTAFSEARARRSSN